MWLSISTLPSCKAGNKNIGKGKVKHTRKKSGGNPLLLFVTNNFMAKSHMASDASSWSAVNTNRIAEEKWRPISSKLQL